MPLDSDFQTRHRIAIALRIMASSSFPDQRSSPWALGIHTAAFSFTWICIFTNLDAKRFQRLQKRQLKLDLLTNTHFKVRKPRVIFIFSDDKTFRISVTIQGVYLCSLFCRHKAVCDTQGLQNDQLKICLVYILGSTGFLQNDLVFLQGQHGEKRPNTTSYVNPRMHFVGFSNSRQTWGII